MTATDRTEVTQEVLARAEAAYLGLALGDALGATVEFMTPREIVHDYGTHCEIIGGGWLKLRAGQVTDDTGMTMALAEAILLSGGRVQALPCATSFDAWMRPRPVDIGNTVRRNLMLFRKTGRPEAPPDEQDAGHGAALRVLPVALATFGLPEDEVLAACRTQAHVTHKNPVSGPVCRYLPLCGHASLR